MDKADLIISGATVIIGAAGLPVMQTEAQSILLSCLVGSGVGSFAGSFLHVTVPAHEKKTVRRELSIKVRKRHVVNFLFGVGLGPILTAFAAMQLPDYIPHFATGIAVSFIVGMLAVILICIIGPAILNKSKILWLIRAILKKKTSTSP